MIFDTHAHYDDNAFNDDRDSLLAALHGSGVGLIVNPGCTVKSSEAAKALSERHPFVYFAAGVHPEELDTLEDGWLESIERLAMDRKCVAIGEIGLDYYWDSSRKEEQKAIFEQQLDLAVRLSMPVIVHDREAHGDCLEIIRRYNGLRGVFHCFSGSAEMAAELLERGWHLGFDGPVTYKNARRAIEVLEITPPDRILLETDSPYLPPVPMRGKRNDSSNIKYIAAKVAEIKGMDAGEIEAVAMENGKRLFGME